MYSTVGTWQSWGKDKGHNVGIHRLCRAISKPRTQGTLLTLITTRTLQISYYLTTALIFICRICWCVAKWFACDKVERDCG